MTSLADLIGKRIAPSDLQRFCTDAMVRCGLSSEDAAVSAEVLTTTDTWGTHSHGTRQIRPLMRAVKSGGIHAGARPNLLREGTGWALVDACMAMPMVVSIQAMEIAIKKAASLILGSDQRYYLIIEMNGNQKGSFRLLKRPFGPQESAF
jgi:LDH2 family malate/lactate/ureidoglycolate dehydrogenase